jgi:flap endonuclease-1
MGIKNLKVVLDRFAKNSVVMKHLSNYSGKKLAIDTSIFIYKYIYNYENFYIGFIQQIIKLKKFGIIPVYIFDGKPPVEKSETIKQRKEKKMQYQSRKNEIEDIMDVKKKRVEEIENTKEEKTEEERVKMEEEMNVLNQEIVELDEEHTKVKKKIIYVTNDMVQGLQEMFRSLGIFYYVANGEADVLCCELMKRNVVDGCISEDSDILVNGGKILLKKFHLMNDFVMEYSLEVILEKLECTYLQFIDMCILCGSDYNSKIPGVGGITAYRYIKEYGNIESMLENRVYEVPEDFDYQQVRNLYINNPMEIHIEEFEGSFIKLGNKERWLNVLEKHNITLEPSIEKFIEKYIFPTNHVSNNKQKNNQKIVGNKKKVANPNGNIINMFEKHALENKKNETNKKETNELVENNIEVKVENK